MLVLWEAVPFPSVPCPGLSSAAVESCRRYCIVDKSLHSKSLCLTRVQHQSPKSTVDSPGKCIVAKHLLALGSIWHSVPMLVNAGMTDLSTKTFFPSFGTLNVFELLINYYVLARFCLRDDAAHRVFMNPVDLFPYLFYFISGLQTIDPTTGQQKMTLFSSFLHLIVLIQQKSRDCQSTKNRIKETTRPFSRVNMTYAPPIMKYSYVISNSTCLMLED